MLLNTRILEGKHSCAPTVAEALVEADPDALVDAVPEALPDALMEAPEDPEAEPPAEEEAGALEAEDETDEEAEVDGATEAGAVVLEEAEVASFLGWKSEPISALIPQIITAITRTAAISATQRRRAYTSGLTGLVGLKGTSLAVTYLRYRVNRQISQYERPRRTATVFMHKGKEFVDTSSIAQAHQRINGWFSEAARDLPWRRPEATPWGIMVSEFMLQQTPVVRVLPVWHEWMRRWATPALLAVEPSGEAVRAWGRLGYPRRALRLHAAAVTIVEEYDGAVPGSPEALLSLPGVGGYTAAAISSFAFRIPAVVVDTNIRRVHARLFTGNALPEPALTAAENALAADLMPADPEQANIWNAAVMELGALICTARSPHCMDCPVQDLCSWVAAGKPEPHYTPKGQAWHGTDRQVRGAIMGVLREAPVSVPRMDLVHSNGRAVPEVLLGEHSEPALAPESVGELAERRVVEAWKKLSALTADEKQRESCLEGLLRDGLAFEADGRISLHG